MRCIDDKKSSLKISVKDSRYLNIVYHGGLHLGRWNTLKLLSETIQSNPELNYRLYITSPLSHIKDVAKEFEGFRVVEFIGSIKEKEEIEYLKNFDIAVHVESFDESAIVYTRLSISSKIPLYLSVGLPLICIGPKILASIQWIEKIQAGIVITNNIKDNIKRALLLLSKKEVREEYSIKSINGFKLYHSMDVVLPKFIESIIKITENK